MQPHASRPQKAEPANPSGFQWKQWLLGEKFPATESGAALKGWRSRVQQRHEEGNAGWTKGSKLAALFEHPLYNIPIPKVTEKDKLFIVNPMEKFSLRSSGSDEW